MFAGLPWITWLLLLFTVLIGPVIVGAFILNSRRQRRHPADQKER